MTDSGIANMVRQRMMDAIRSYCFGWIAFAFEDEDFAREVMSDASDAQVIEFLQDVEPGFPLLPRRAPCPK